MNAPTLILYNGRLHTMDRLQPLASALAIAGDRIVAVGDDSLRKLAGATTQMIDLGGASVSAGDGILLIGKTLYVVRNRLNQIAVIKLSRDLTSGTVTDTLTNANFDVPTTIGLFGDALYAVNARFGTPPTPDTTYTAVRVPLESDDD